MKYKMKSLFTKIICAVLLCALALSVCACSSKTEPTPSSEENCDNGHDMKETAYTAPTCKTTGSKVFTCTRCGYTETETLLTIPCNYQVKSTIPSTCTVKGSQLLECSMCHVQKTEELPLKEHNYQLVNTIPSTCITQGRKEYQCADCPATKSETLPLGKHKYERKTILATCFTHGGERDVCLVCGDTKVISETPFLTHSWSSDNYCTHCGIYKTLFDIEKLNVSYSMGMTCLGTIRGDLVPKFNQSDKAIAKEYWIEHTVTLTITLFDEESTPLGNPTFQSTTNENGELILHHINNCQPNKFTIFFGKFDYFAEEQLKQCKSFKIEISCEGYEKIEKTYQIKNN